VNLALKILLFIVLPVAATLAVYIWSGKEGP
jgi:hypothetical protein